RERRRALPVPPRSHDRRGPTPRGREAPARAGGRIPGRVALGGGSDRARGRGASVTQDGQGGPERPVPVRVGEEIQEVPRSRGGSGRVTLTPGAADHDSGGRTWPCSSPRRIS